MSKTFRRKKRQWDDDNFDDRSDNVRAKRRNAEVTRQRKQTRDQMLNDMLQQEDQGE